MINVQKDNVRKYSIRTKNMNTVHLTIEDSPSNNGIITISCDNVVCATPRINCDDNGILNWFCNINSEELIKHLLPQKQRIEFDSKGCKSEIESKIKAIFDNKEGDNQGEFEDFWDENSYSFEECESHAELSQWVSSNFPVLDDLELYEYAKKETYTIEAYTIIKNAIPVIKKVFRDGLIQ